MPHNPLLWEITAFTMVDDYKHRNGEAEVEMVAMRSAGDVSLMRPIPNRLVDQQVRHEFTDEYKLPVW